jgi:DNA-binding GntR family transcriptional regulator
VRVDEAALTALARGRLEQLGSTDLRDLGDLRSAVAGTAARLAAARASARDLQDLHALLDRFGEAPRPSHQRRLEGRYYLAIAAAAQSARLTQQEFQLQAELGQVVWAILRSPAEVVDVVAAHEAVLSAVRARDAEAARRLTEAHVDLVTHQLIGEHIRLTRGQAAS